VHNGKTNPTLIPFNNEVYFHAEDWSTLSLTLKKKVDPYRIMSISYVPHHDKQTHNFTSFLNSAFHNTSQQRFLTSDPQNIIRGSGRNHGIK